MQSGTKSYLVINTAQKNIPWFAIGTKLLAVEMQKLACLEISCLKRLAVKRNTFVCAHLKFKRYERTIGVLSCLVYQEVKKDTAVCVKSSFPVP